MKISSPKRKRSTKSSSSSSSASSPKRIRRSTRTIIKPVTSTFQKLRLQRLLRNQRHTQQQSKENAPPPRRHYVLSKQVIVQEALDRNAESPMLQQQIRLRAHLDLVYCVKYVTPKSNGDKGLRKKRAQSDSDWMEHSRKPSPMMNVSMHARQLQHRFHSLFGSMSPEEAHQQSKTQSPSSDVATTPPKACLLAKTTSQQSSKSTTSLEAKFAELFGKESPIKSRSFSETVKPSKDERNRSCGDKPKSTPKTHLPKRSSRSATIHKSLDAIPTENTDAVSEHNYIRPIKIPSNVASTKAKAKVLTDTTNSSATRKLKPKTNSKSHIDKYRIPKFSKSYEDVTAHAKHSRPSPSRVRRLSSTLRTPLKRFKGPRTPDASPSKSKPKKGPQTPKTPYPTQVPYRHWDDQEDEKSAKKTARIKAPSVASAHRRDMISYDDLPFWSNSNVSSWNDLSDLSDHEPLLGVRRKIGPRTPSNTPPDESSTASQAMSPPKQQQHHHRTPSRSSSRRTTYASTPKSSIRSAAKMKASKSTPKRKSASSPTTSKVRRQSKDCHLQLIFDEEDTTVSSSSSSTPSSGYASSNSMVALYLDVKRLIRSTALLLHDENW